MSWRKVKLSEFLKTRELRFKPNAKEIKNLQRIDKIKFDGTIFLSNSISKTDMILIKNGDLVISGINVHKGAIAVYEGKEDITATIHYSSYEYDKNKIDIEFLKIFLKSAEFLDAIKEQVPGGIKTEIKPKHLLPLEVVIPDIDEQKVICKNHSSFEIFNKNLNSEIEKQNDLLIQLRQAFLREAMQGKLVPQDKNDESASELLKRIKAEKEKLIAEGKIKKQKQLPEIKPEEIPYEIPESWVWCRLGEVVELSRGRFSNRPRNDPRFYGGQYPFIQIGSLDEFGSIINDYRQTLNEDGLKVSKMFPSNTIVVAIVGGTIGNLGILGTPMCFPDSMVGIFPMSYYNQEYILSFLRYNQPFIKQAVYQMAGQPNIKIPTLANLLLPLSPLAEQQRIVTKLEQLMQLCSELEKNINQSKEETNLLLQTVLREALEEKEN